MAVVFGALNPSSQIVFAAINDPTVQQTVTAPLPPTLTATSGDSTATASWTPTSDGGSPITKWLIRIYDPSDGLQPPIPTEITDPNARSYTFSGLANGSSYRIELAAVNIKGASPFAFTNASPRAAATVPDPPTGITLGPILTGATLSLTAPANMGTGTLTGYQVTVTDTVTGVIYPYSLILAPATLLGLPNGHTMSVEIRTVTTDGVSAGATAFVTPAEYPPATTPPDAPTGGVVTAYADGLGLSWTAPAVVGTYPIADYVIRASSASGGQFDHWYVSTTTSANIGGLGTDQDWSIDIWSRSMAGQSLASLS
jgi:hypothetical protein